jgi:hypothetical protein
VIIDLVMIFFDNDLKEGEKMKYLIIGNIIANLITILVY